MRKRPTSPTPARPTRASARRREVHASARTQARDVYRTSILEAAERVFARRGWQETKVADIAKEAGLAAGTLYNYFDSKERILESIIEWRGGQMLDEARIIAARPGTPLERLSAYSQWKLARLERDGTLMQMFAQANGGPPLIHARQCISENYKLHLDISTDLIKAAQTGATLRKDHSAADLALALSGIMSAHIAAWLHLTPRVSLVERWPRVFDLFLNGAAPR